MALARLGFYNEVRLLLVIDLGCTGTPSPNLFLYFFSVISFFVFFLVFSFFHFFFYSLIFFIFWCVFFSVSCGKNKRIRIKTEGVKEEQGDQQLGSEEARSSIFCVYPQGDQREQGAVIVRVSKGPGARETSHNETVSAANGSIKTLLIK